MKIFLSWSGKRSQVLAGALRDWLPLVLQYVDPWLSDKDIAAGERWSLEVGKELEVTNFGILCLTSENLNAPWVLFEAGALSKIVQVSAVCPYLLDLDVKDVTGPLSQFQAKKADKEGTFDLLKSINMMASQPLDASRLRPVFEGLWNSLEVQLNDIPAPLVQQQARSQAEILEDLVTIVRRLEYRMRSFDDRLKESEIPRSPILRHSLAVQIRAGEDVKHFKAGDVLEYYGTDLIESLKAVLALPPEGFGKEWYLRDDERNHFLTFEEARDVKAYFGAREPKVVLTRVPF